MRKLKNFSRAIIAIAMMLITAFDSLAHDFEVDGIYYSITDSTTHTVAVTYQGEAYDSYSNEYTGAVTIPSSVTYNGTNYSVTTIGNYAFVNCAGLSSVVIGEYVKEVGDCAFYSCTNMVEVTIGNSVTEIGEWAFYQCRSLTSVTIPNSVTTIGNYAFGVCTGLITVSIGNSVSEIGRSAFDSCSGLTEISIPNSVNKIGENAFFGTGWYNNQPDGILFLDNCCLRYKGDKNQLTGALTLKENTRLIADKAFYGCRGLTSVTIPNSVIAIGIGAFSCKGLTQIIVENGNLNYDSRDNCNAIIETSTNTLISGCKNTIIPNSITSIGDNAFAECSGLVSMIIPNSLTTIGSYAFESCTGLTSVTIPNSVTKIGSYAFFSCTGLTKVTSLNPEPPTCQSDCFYGVDVANCTLEVPAGAKEAYASADCWNDFVNIVEIVTVEVSTQENNATFEIPTTQGAVLYTVNVYSDEAMTQLVATTNYDASGNIILMSTSLELSIDGFADGSYYYDVIAKSESGETLSNYTGSFEIDTTGATGIEGLTSDETTATEVARYDIHGRLLSAPTKGINIVKYSDGTVKKIIHN